MSIARRITACLAAALVTCAATAEPFPVPPMAPAETGRYRCLDRKTGEERWRAEWVTAQGEEDGIRVLRSREEGEGVYGKKSVPLFWSRQTTWEIETIWAPRRTVYEFRDPDGELHERTEVVYLFPDDGDGTVTVRTTAGDNGKPRTASVRVPPGTIGTEALTVPFRTLPFGADLERRFPLVTETPKLFRMRLVYAGEETVTVPAGTFRCHKIRMVPELGFFGFLAKPFVPDTYFWHSMEAPHLWVKYEGLESGLGTPRVIMELVSFSPDTELK
jgi:hypothetical protein